MRSDVEDTARPDMSRPHFVNEQGDKWWRDERITDYALRQGPGVLVGAAAFIVETPDGERSHVLVRKGAVIAQSQRPDALADKIDRLRSADGLPR